MALPSYFFPSSYKEGRVEERRIPRAGGVNIIYGHASKHGYQKEGGCTVQVNPLCPYDFVPLQDYKDDDMTFEAHYNHVMPPRKILCFAKKS